MQETQHGFPSQPVWQRQVRPRLVVCIAIASIVVASILLLPRQTDLPAAKPPEITVQLLADETTPAPAEEYTPIEELPDPVARSVEPLVKVPESTLPVANAPAEAVTRDWYAEIESVAREAVDAREAANVMQPAQLEARRRAAVQFAPSRAPVRKPIWENVEIDHIGRKVLVSGDCYRVLEDWRATYQDIQREFGQYLVHCNSGGKEYPLDVAWIGEVGQKYAYIRYPDGEIPEDEFNELIRKY